MSSIKCITLEEEIKKNPELKMSDIKILKEWCEKQPHLPKIQDVQLAIFLHSNYYRLEPTKKTIDNYYTIRTQVPELFSDRDLKAEKLQEAFKVLFDTKQTMASIKLVTYEEELNKNPKELKEDDVQMLREWCKKQPHLPKISDSELALFLHSNYYRLEPTKTTIDTFFTVRSHVPEFFSDRDLINNKELKKASLIVAQQILEGTTREGYKIIFGRLIDSDPSHFVYNDVMKLLNMVIDLWLYTQGTCDGHVILFDMNNVSFGHVGRLSPMGLKKFLYYLQEGLPVRLRGFHFMNASPVIDVILNMMKPFMKKQLMDMFHMHTSSDTLSKFISLEILPNEAGGKAGPIMELHTKQIKQLEESIPWFKEEEANHRINESLRPGKAKSATDLFGVEGSFKKLEID